MKRYESLYFPASEGCPYETNYFALAFLRALWKVFLGAWEGRIIDRVTGDHTVI